MATSAPMDNKSFFTEYGEANRFSIHEVIGKGSYGVVCSATDNKTGEKVAIKKIIGTFDNDEDAKRTLREIRLLQHFNHENVLNLRDIMLPPPGSLDQWNDIYLSLELMDTDLHKVIRAAQATGGFADARDDARREGAVDRSGGS